MNEGYRLWQLVALLIIGQPDVRPLTPADAIGHAAADLIRLPFDAGQHTRYLSLYNVPAAERSKVSAVLNGHCNGLSREPDLTPLVIVPNTAGSLLRIDLRNYRWDRSTWEKLSDPYFTVTVEVETFKVTPWEGGLWEGKFYAAGAFEYKKPVKVRTQQALAPWLTETPEARDKLEKVVTWTQSKIPVVRGDWFFNQTAAAAGRIPNYYDFLAVKDEATFRRAIGADVKLAEEFGSELREAVAISGVTLNPRAIARHATLGGGYWRTFDFEDKNGGKSPLRVLGKDVEGEYAASEQFGHLPNGLWATGLFDRAGKVQATAPDSVASDGHSRSNDRRIHVNVSCLRCHSDGGLQPIDGWVRNLLTPPLAVQTPDAAKARELRRQYLRRLEPFLSRDRLTFEDAIKEATGLDSKGYSKAHAAYWESYEDRKIGIDDAAADLGTTRATLAAALDATVKANQGDTVLSVLLLNNPRINRVPVRVWEDSFPAAMLMLKGFRQ